MIFTLPDVRHNQSGFETLACLYAQTKHCSFDHIEIDMVSTHWFDADMCAAFGAILCKLSDKVNTIKLTNISCGTKEILAKNGFLSYYEYEKIPDSWKTTIPYKRFDTKDERYFADYIKSKLICSSKTSPMPLGLQEKFQEYIKSKLMRRPEMPTMSLGLQKKFQESILEIFSNAVLHSRTELGIFSCGQFFPKRHRLNFSVADLGIGICQNIKEAGVDRSPKDAIVWATTDCNTTKQGQVPGGLGLKLLSEFIDMNGGCIQIVSDAGYWKREKGKPFSASLSHPFPGTVVNVEIDTDDNHAYILSSELTMTDIF